MLPWAEILQPAVKVARYGFAVSKDLVRAMDNAGREHEFLTEDPTWAIDFAPNGTRVGLGDTMTRKRYASSLEAIARYGSSIFYTGRMADMTIAAVKRMNGTMTLEDLLDYEVISRPPVEIDFHGYRVAGCGSPASGAVTMSVLKTIEGYKGFRDNKNMNLSTHRLVEAMRFGYGKVRSK